MKRKHPISTRVEREKNTQLAPNKDREKIHN
jgi:hypothetical protein